MKSRHRKRKRTRPAPPAQQPRESVALAVDELKARIDGRLVVASISGGKDSAALSLYLHELGIEHCRVFMDTGWENERTYEYIRGPLTEKIGPIEWLKGKLDMVNLIRKKGMFPGRLNRFCTEHLKMRPIRDHLRGLDEEPINTVGIRAGESAARAKMPEWEFSKELDCDVWRPIHKWTEQQVIDIHKRHGLPPNPLYLLGASRVGCWPCIFARKSEVRFIAERDTGRINEIRELELEVMEIARLRYEAKGETFESLGYKPPTFFRKSRAKTAELWPIDKVVDWSRTARGGKQYELFAGGDAEAGCMRWGLCETNDEDDGRQ